MNAKFFRKIQKLKISTALEDIEEHDFYISVRNVFDHCSKPDVSENMGEIHFPICPVDKAKNLARENGFQLLEIGNKLYLSWAEITNPED